MKRFMSTFTVGFLCLAFFTGGCVVTKSENVETGGMWAHFIVEHYTDDTVLAWGVLRVGGQSGTIIDLVGADRMECNGVRMVEYIEPLTNFHWTRAEVPVDQDGVYDFDFIREDEEVTTTVVTPDVPFIENPLPGDTVIPEEEIPIEWDATYPGDYVNLFLTGDCIQNQAETNVEDDGDFRTASVQDQDPQNPGDCALYLEIRRLLVDDVNAAFQGGYTEAKRMDGIDLSFEQ